MPVFGKHILSPMRISLVVLIIYRMSFSSGRPLSTLQPLLWTLYSTLTCLVLEMLLFLFFLPVYTQYAVTANLCLLCIKTKYMRPTSGVISHLLPTLLFGDKVCHISWNSLIRLDWLAYEAQLSSWPHPSIVRITYKCTPCLYMGFWASKSGPCVYEANTLLSELSHQSFGKFLIERRYRKESKIIIKYPLMN